jgi:hypothetical protein
MGAFCCYGLFRDDYENTVSKYTEAMINRMMAAIYRSRLSQEQAEEIFNLMKKMSSEQVRETIKEINNTPKQKEV